LPSFQGSFYRPVGLAAICLLVTSDLAKAQSAPALVFTITGNASNYPGSSNNPSFVAPGTETLSGTIQASTNCSFGDPTYGIYISCPVTTLAITDGALGVTLTVPANDAACPFVPAMNYYLAKYYPPSSSNPGNYTPPPIAAGQWVLNCKLANIPNSAFNVTPGPPILLIMNPDLGGHILDINVTGGPSFTASTGTLYYLEYGVGNYPATTSGTYAGSYTITPVGIKPEIFSLSGSLPSTGSVTGVIGGGIVANCPTAGTPCPILAINVISDTAGASTAFIVGNSLALVDTPEAPLQDLWGLSGNLTDSTGNVILTTSYQGALEGPGAGWVYDSGALTGIYNINLDDTTAPVSGKSLGKCACPVGDPIDVGSGNVYEQVTDYSTAGQNRLQFIRSYNSAMTPTQAVALGHNWRSNFDRYVVISASSVLVERSDGQQLTFTLNSGKWQPDSDVDITLANDGSTWTLIDSNDTVEIYMASVPLLTVGPVSSTSVAYLRSIQLRNGYTQTFQYNSIGQMTAVTDSYGRALQFEYSGVLLKTVITPDGLALAYNYNSSGLNPGVLDRLVSVTYPTTPQGSVTYLYGAGFALGGIIDENGNNYVSWGYDLEGRGSGNALGASVLETVTYDGDGSRVVTNAYNEQEVYKLATLQGVPKVTEIDRLANGSIPAAKRLFTYDANGYPASSTDWNGNLTTLVNNNHGQPTIINEAVGTSAVRTTTITYDEIFGHLPASIATPGLTTTFSYDAQGNLVTKTLTDTTATIVPYATKGQTRIWKYTWANALLTSVTTPKGNATTFSYA
jgi:YD repeat-containing protein